MDSAKNRSSERKDAEQNREKVREAIRKVELENPLHVWQPSQVYEKIEGLMTYRTLLSCLSYFRGNRYVRKIEKGCYLSKDSLFWKEILREWMIHEVIMEQPELDNEDFSKQFLLQTKMARENVEKQRGKNIPHYLALRLMEKFKGEGSKYDQALILENMARHDVSIDMRNDLEFIRNATEITLLCSKADLALDISKLRSAIAEFLYEFLSIERCRNVKAENPKSFMKNKKFKIQISFDAEKAISHERPKLTRPLSWPRFEQNLKDTTFTNRSHAIEHALTELRQKEEKE